MDNAVLIIFLSLTSRSALWSVSIAWVGFLSGFHNCCGDGEQGNYCSCQLQKLLLLPIAEITAPANYRNAGPLTHSHIPNLPDLCVTDVVMSDAKF